MLLQPFIGEETFLANIARLGALSSGWAYVFREGYLALISLKALATCMWLH
jgi:hypothetical protein